jgi:hypothetical protein
MPNLPDHTLAVINFLKSKNFKDGYADRIPYSNLRRTLYEESGLHKIFGDYKGSSGQNSALLNYLQKTIIQ